MRTGIQRAGRAARIVRAAHTACLAAIISLAGIQSGMAANESVGTTAIARNAVSGTLLSTTRQLTAGIGVFQNERIRTGSDGSAQLLFLDLTSLKIDANSNIVLSRLVFDPQKKRGHVVLNAVSGAFRFVSGSSPKKNYQIRTRFGTIGIRGTIVLMRLARA